MSAASEYLLIFRESTPEVYDAMSDTQRAECLNRWNQWFDELVAEGKVTDGKPLEPQGRVVSGRGSQVSDGPFAEAKEAIGGFFLVSATSLDEATDIARGCPSLPYGITVEVRPVSTGCHLAKSLGYATMRG